MVHRAVGKPGVVLVGEGSPNRLPSLLAAEKKRVSRVAYDVPIYDIQVGDEDGQVPIRRLQRHIMKLPRNLKGPAVADLNYRLKALPQSLQMPKGPMPRHGRMPKAPRPSSADAMPGVTPARCAPLDPDDDGVGRLVVQSAQVGVEDQRRDHGQEQQRPDQRTSRSRPACRRAAPPAGPAAACPP